MFKALKIRNGGWVIVPATMLSDLGLHYDLNLGFIRRRVYKSSIDAEYEFGALTGTLFAVAWITSTFVRMALWTALRVLGVVRPRR